MVHTYQIKGMTCTSCQAKVQEALTKVSGVKKININLPEGTAEITMEKHIPIVELQEALKNYPRYQLSDLQISVPLIGDETEEKSWLETYKPILLIFSYITVLAILVGFSGHHFDTMLSMRVFMGAFFLTFSFFKMLDLQGFAESYSTYDIVAKRLNSWGYIYVFIELGLGFSFVMNVQPFIVNIVTLIVMTVSLIGVLESVLNKKKIRCACLGAVFNLPMSTVTIVEDGLMILMNGGMLLAML